MSAFAVLVALPALALLLWWLPARAGAGYYVPDIRGEITDPPYLLDLIWVRPWPWITAPPVASMSLHLASGRTIRSIITGPSVSFFAARAVALQPSTANTTTPAQSGRVIAISVLWPEGKTETRETHLFAVKPSQEVGTGVLGFSGMGAAKSSAEPSAVVVAQIAPRTNIVGVATPDPGSSAWATPRCLSVKNVAAATSGSSTDLRRVTKAMTTSACKRPSGPHVLVLAPKPPDTDVFFVFPAAVRVIQDGKVEDVSSGISEDGFAVPVDAFNWWRFIAGFRRTGNSWRSSPRAGRVVRLRS